MLSILCAFITLNHNLKMCILPQLSGTESEMELQEVSLSKPIPVSVLLEPLEEGEESKLLQIELVDKQSEPKHREFFQSLLENPLFLQAVDSLGRIPRFFQFFVKHVINPREANRLFSVFVFCVELCDE